MAILVKHCSQLFEVSVALVGFVHMHYHWGWLGQRKPASTRVELMIMAWHVHYTATAGVLFWCGHELVSIT